MPKKTKKTTYLAAAKAAGYLKPGGAFKALPKRGTAAHRAILARMR